MNEVVLSEAGVSLQLDPVELEALMRISTMLPGSLAQKLSMVVSLDHKESLQRGSCVAARGGVTASMTFQLPEDQDSLDDALHASDMRCLFYEIFSEARSTIKHGAPFLGVMLNGPDGVTISDESEKALCAVTSYLRREFSARGIRWED